MKLHCIDELKNGQQLFMPSGLIASVTVNPEKKEIWLQYQDELNTISDVVSFKDFEKLIQDGIEILRDDLPMALSVMEGKTDGRKQQIELAARAEGIDLSGVQITPSGIDISDEYSISEKYLKFAEIMDLMDRYNIDYNVFYRNIRTPNGDIKMPDIGFNDNWLGETDMNEAFGIADNIELEIPDELVNSIAQSGDNEEAVNAALENADIKEQLARYTDKELLSAIDSYAIDLTAEERKNRKVLEQYVVWLIAWNIADDDYEQNDELAESLLNEDELDDEINQDIANSFSQEELIVAAQNNLNSLMKDVLDEGDIYLYSEIYQDLTGVYDMILKSEFSDFYALLNVKGRPNITFDIEALGVDEDIFYDELEYWISDFADELKEEFPNFTILGRSGGYWGLKLSYKDLVFTRNLAEKLVEEIFSDSDYLEWVTSSKDIKTADDFVSSYWLNSSSDFWSATNAIVDWIYELGVTNTVDFSDEFKETWNKFKSSIDTAEKEVNNVDFWKRRLEETLEDNNNIVHKLLNEDELDDEINQDLSSSFSQEELIDAAESNLNSRVRDIFDYGDSSLDSEVYDYLAYKYDFIHRQEYGDDYILLDVKGRPNLSFGADDLGIDDETFYYELNYQISDFADELKEEFPGFVVLGRSGGYWGLEVSHGDLKFTKNLAEKFVEEIMNDSEYLEDALASPEIKTADDLVEDFWYSNTIDFGHDSVLDILDEMSFTDAVDFTDEFKKSLEDLKTSIDSAEKEMNNIDFWKERFENDEVADELLSDETGEDEDV